MNDHRPTHSYFNAAQSQVGAQGGDVFGGVHFTGRADDAGSVRSLAEQLTDLRDALAAAHAAGYLDEATFTQADAALDEAHAHSGADDPVSRSALMSALDRAKNLVSGIAGLVAAIGAVTSAIGSVR
jgi:hypothetical protein